MLNRARRSPPQFFARVLGLSVPFWLLGIETDAVVMPGLSVSALMTFCPAAAAFILVDREHTAGGIAALLRRSLDFHRIKNKGWYIPILLLMPCISVVVYGLLRWQGVPLPAPHVALLPALLMFVAFFVGALGEELGWSGYALDPMQQRWNAVQAGAIFGIVGIIWHLVPLIALHRTPTWIAWWCLYAVASRVLIVWLYNNTAGSVCAVALFHATLNFAYALFPINGSHFDMRYGALLTAFAALVVIGLWGPSTLTRHLRA